VVREEVLIDYDYYETEECNMYDLRKTIERLSNITEDQFYEIKNEKWYQRVFNMITFSKKNEKRMANQIGSLAQAQQILIEILVRLSKTDEELSDLILKNVESIKRLAEHDNVLIKRIQQLENSLILGSNSSFTIINLNERERQILSGCFFKLMEKFDYTSENQKRYAHCVLNVIDTETTIENLEKAICDIENRISIKNVLTCCLEYIFLHSNQIEEIDEFKDFIEYFDVGGKTIKSIKKRIQDIYNLRGEQGFLDKYTQEEHEVIDEVFCVEIEEDQEVLVTTEEKLDEYISNSLHIGQNEEKIFKNKNIHINTCINCEGNLIFDNCIIYYNELNSINEIILLSDANLTMKNCKIICKDTNEKYFIKSEDKDDFNVNIINCELIDCSNFLYLYSPRLLKVENCIIRNGYIGFITGRILDGGMAKIENCFIEQNDISDFNVKCTEINKYDKELINLYGNNITVKECFIIETELFKQKMKKNERNIHTYFSVDNGYISNCTFVGATKCIKTNGNISECKFENCDEVIAIKNFYCDIVKQIRDCVFIDCTKVADLGPKVHMLYCQFVRCRNNFIKTSYCGGVTIEYCEFINTTYLNDEDYKQGCMEFCRGKEHDTNYSTMKKCIFDGADLNKGFLIYCSGYEKPKGTVIYIDECNFINCTTKRESGKIVKEYMQYNSVLRRNIDFKATNIYSCKGLDKVNRQNSETDQIQVKSTSTAGGIIGSSIKGYREPILERRDLETKGITGLMPGVLNKYMPAKNLVGVGGIIIGIKSEVI